MALADTFACPWHGERPPDVGVRGEGLALAGEELSASSDEQDRVHLLRRAHGAWGARWRGVCRPSPEEEKEGDLLLFWKSEAVRVFAHGTWLLGVSRGGESTGAGPGMERRGRECWVGEEWE